MLGIRGHDQNSMATNLLQGCTGADLEIFDKGGPIDYPVGIYQNFDHTKIVATKYLSK